MHCTVTVMHILSWSSSRGVCHGDQQGVVSIRSLPEMSAVRHYLNDIACGRAGHAVGALPETLFYLQTSIYSDTQKEDREEDHIYICRLGKSMTGYSYLLKEIMKIWNVIEKCIGLIQVM